LELALGCPRAVPPGARPSGASAGSGAASASTDQWTEAVTETLVLSGVDERNWQQPDLDRALWKFVADHTAHRIAVIREYGLEFDQIA
jgi:hypothetical protein